MTTVFDAQSDAVVIVGQDANILEDNQQQDYELVELKLPEFKFSNSKSVELFGVDLQNLKHETTKMMDSFLDIKKFVCLETKNKEY